jgi:hypothetical protein
VRVYSLHLGTMAGLAPAGRRDQLQAVLRDAGRYPRVVIGGDLNDPGTDGSRGTSATRGRPSTALPPRGSEGWITSFSRGSGVPTASLRARYSMFAVPATTSRFGPSELCAEPTPRRRLAMKADNQGTNSTEVSLRKPSVT